MVQYSSRRDAKTRTVIVGGVVQQQARCQNADCYSRWRSTAAGEMPKRGLLVGGAVQQQARCQNADCYSMWRSTAAGEMPKRGLL